jgi:hypothetical protein
MKGWRSGLVALALLTVTAAARPAQAGTWDDAGWGALSVFANLGYMPAKLVYGAVGAMTGGLAYACTLGDYQTAETIWVTSLGGTYVLTPGMLRGDETFAFAGTPGEPATVGVEGAPRNAGAAAEDDGTKSTGLSEQSLDG